MIAAHETAVDESFNRPPADRLYAAGTRIVVVYATGQGKAISDAEWNAYLGYRGPDGGRLGLILVDEHGNQQMLSGPGFGTSIAREMLAVAKRRLTPDRPLYYVADDPSPLPSSRWGEVADRFREICAEHLQQGWSDPGDTVGGSLVGAYGSGPLLEHLYGLGLARWPWSVATWGPCPHAVLVQDPNTGKDRMGGAVDWDYLPDGVTDCGQYPPPDQGADLTPDESRMLTELHKALLDPVDNTSPDNLSGSGVPWAANQTLVLVRTIEGQLAKLAPGTATAVDIPALAAAIVAEVAKRFTPGG